MQQNQKYFALADGDGKLVPRFLVVSNLETTDPRAIIDGNERVLRARLADARFFFDQDRKVRLEARVPKTGRRSSITTSSGRSSIASSRLARALERTRRHDRRGSGRMHTRAARLAKADLTTDMVGEFPELQGLMGRYYAEHDGEPATVAAAIEQHYWPRFAGDALPEAPVAQAVALADKLETLAGMFGIGAQPTGDKDPFGLRRHAIGVIRIVVEKGLAGDVSRDLAAAAFGAFAGVPAVQDARIDLENFIYERLRATCATPATRRTRSRPSSASGRRGSISCPRRPPPCARSANCRRRTPLAAANKRIVNILRKSGSEAATAVDRARLADGAEHDLYLAFQKLEPVVDDRCATGDFAGALVALASAKPAVDRFFDDVLVMADDPAIRANRLALLRGVAQTMNRVADISQARRLDSAPSVLTHGPARLRSRRAHAGGQAHRPRPRRRDQPRQRPVHQVAGRMAADPGKPRGDRAAESRRLSRRHRHEPVGHRPRPLRHGDAQRDPRQDAQGAGPGRRARSTPCSTARTPAMRNAIAASRKPACCGRSASGTGST